MLSNFMVTLFFLKLYDKHGISGQSEVSPIFKLQKQSFQKIYILGNRKVSPSCCSRFSEASLEWFEGPSHLCLWQKF